MTWKPKGPVELDSLVVDVNTTTPALRVTQTGTGNALVVEDSTSPDASPFVVDANGNVGIGTTTPSVLLELSARSDTAPAPATLRLSDTDVSVQQAQTLGAVEFYSFDGSVNGTGVKAFVNAIATSTVPSADLVFGTNNSANGADAVERMRINSIGNVGIGTTAPSRPLDVRSATEDNSAFWNTSDSAFTTVKQRFVAGTANSGIADLVVQRQNGTATDMLIALRDSGGTVNNVMRITSAGNVGIGTSSPNFRLDIHGTTALSSGLRAYNSSSGVSDASQLTVATGGGVQGTLFALGTQAVYLGSDTNHPLAFRTNSVERMRINQTGLITGTGTSLGAWTAYTPTLTASVTNPTLGSGSTAEGFYSQIGKIVHFRARFKFGTSGTAFGSGTYYASLPITARAVTYPQPQAHTLVHDVSTGEMYLGHSLVNSNTTVSMRVQADSTGSEFVTPTVPFTWANEDEIFVTGTYEAA